MNQRRYHQRQEEKRAEYEAQLKEVAQRMEMVTLSCMHFLDGADSLIVASHRHPVLFSVVVLLPMEAIQMVVCRG